MIKNYSIDNHLYNLKWLKHECFKVTCMQDEDSIFQLINEVADFIESNQHYLFINSYNTLVDGVVEIISFCNSKEYKLEKLIDKYIIFKECVNKFRQDVSSAYKIYLHISESSDYQEINKYINCDIKIVQDLDKLNSSCHSNEPCFIIKIIDKHTKLENHNWYDEIIYYDEFIQNMLSLTEGEYYSNYDFNYLFNSIEKAKGSDVNTIIVGSSYSAYGIHESYLKENVVNLSLPSQDVAYSYEVAKKIIEKNSNIKTCYIGTGYWTLFFDLSKSIKSEAYRIESVYNPILNGINQCFQFIHSVEVKVFNSVSDLHRKIFNLSKIYENLNKQIYNSSNTYFNDNRVREYYSLIENCKLKSIDDTKKFIMGKNRAEDHNKLSKYHETNLENEIKLDDFISYLTKKNIKPIIVNFPNTKYYLKYLEESFISSYYSTINRLKTKNDFEFMDLNKLDIFKDEDFVDFDHLSDIGAKKASHFLIKTFR